MKKILLATTTLIGAASLFAGAAMADAPKVTLGGTADFQLGVANQDNDSSIRSSAFRSDTEVTVRIDGKTDGGLGYGGGVDIETDTTADADTQGTNASRTFVYVEGNWGRVQGGSDLGVTNTMKVDASRIAHGTGGIDGDWYYFSNFAAPASGIVIAKPDLVLDYGATTLGDETTENANKVSYYTPKFSGFQAGISYLFDSGNKGQTVGLADTTAGEADNIIGGALSWEGKFDQVGIALGATGEWGNGQTAATEDLRTWQVGGKLSYMGFALAGSYGDWSDSLSTTAGLDERNFWTAGVSYETGPFGASVTWFDSTYEATSTLDNEFNNLSVGVDYKLAPGFTPYAEVSFFDYDPSGTSSDNDGTIFIAGTQLSF